MTLKSARIARAEDLTAAERQEAGITIEEGLIVLEIHNEKLHEKGVPIGEGGFSAYLESHGEFKDIGLDE